MKGFTPNQERAMRARGNVLVQAGAGAGKTSTLVQRCVGWLLEDPRNSLDEVLMVTFTEAAAAEMRQRIRAGLEDALAGRPGDNHLAEQLALLDTATICTLHSFCLRLVREHFYELNLDPQIAVLAEEEARLLEGDVLEAILKNHYAGGQPNSRAAQDLIETQPQGRDQVIRKLVLRLHEYSQTLPDPARWFSEQLALFAAPAPTRWVEWLRAELPRWRAEWRDELRAHAGIEPVDASLSALQDLPEVFTFDQAGKMLQRIAEADEDWPRGTKEKVRTPIKNFFLEAAFLRALTGDGQRTSESGGEISATSQTSVPAALAEDWAWSRGGMRALLELTQEFGRAYAEAKREQGTVDFHDLEQFSLRLLWYPTADRPTALARHWQRKLRLVFVDEYQDINAAQDAILRALARAGSEANRFLVGDVKQSIYRFRLANPHIFQNYAQMWAGGANFSEVIPLSDNFRSHEGILAFLNPFFSKLMRREIGGVEFGPEAHLQFGDRENRRALTWAGGPAAGFGAAAHVELHLRLKSRDSVERETNEANDGEDAAFSDLSDTEKEARMVGLRLREMHATRFKIWDEETRRFRPVVWSDIVILLRSPRGKVESFAKEFLRLGIPLLASRGGFFDSPEIRDLMSLLKLLDNPLQDIETIAVLRSPIVGLTLDELAMIRLAGPGRFWTAMLRYLRQPADGTGFELPGKLSRFLEHFTKWRRLARQTSLSQCLDEILKDTGYLTWVAAQPRAKEGRANIFKLFQWARRFDEFHRQGLFRFLSFIEAQRDAEIDHEPAPVETENAVRILSIHQSKGLEFPVVVVADLGKAFNLSDLHGDIILDEEFGVCPQVKPPGAGQRYPSLPYWLGQRRQRAEMLGEEMRILYVALTRACHTLVLAGTVSESRARERWPQASGFGTRDVLQARSHLDWLGPWLAEAAGRADWIDCDSGEGRWLRWTLYQGNDPRLALEAVESAADEKETNPLPAPAQDQLDRLQARLIWQYPFAALSVEPAKASISMLRRRARADVEADWQPFEQRALPPRERRGFSGLSAAEIGTAHHLFLQFLDLERAGSEAELGTEARRLEAEGVLSAAECAALDLPALADFWRSDVGRQLLANRLHLHREMPFTARLSGDDLAKLLPVATDESPGPLEEMARFPEEFLVAQGIVDLAVILPEEIWLLDFKTDALAGPDWQSLARAYAPQLQLYSLALARIYRRPVTRCWLHLLALRRTVLCGEI